MKPNSGRSIPLTPWQTDLWLAERLLTPRTALLISTRFHAPARFTAERVQAAAEAVLRAHPLLSSTIDESAGIPVLMQQSTPVEIRSVRATDAVALGAQLHDAVEPFGLERSLVRATVGTAEREQTSLVQFDTHHLVFDGISQRLLFERFTAALAGETGTTAGDAAYFPYALSCAAAESLLSGPARARARDTARHLDGMPQGALGPTGPLRQATFPLSGDQYAAWVAAHARAGCKPASLAVAVVLRAVAACEPVPLLAITADARPRDHSATLGDFANVLPMLFENADSAGAHAAIAAAEREMAIVRSLREQPVWSALPGTARGAAIGVPVITYRRFFPRVLGPDVRVSPFLPNRHAKRRLTFQILDGDGTLVFRIESDATRMSDEAFARLLASFHATLRADGIEPGSAPHEAHHMGASA